MTEPVKRLTYNLLQCPEELLDLLKDMYNDSKPEHAGLKTDQRFEFIDFIFEKILQLNLAPCSFEHGQHGGSLCSWH